MIYKTIDSKEKEIAKLKELLVKSNNAKQRAFIKADLQRIENGYKAEKDNAYYLDFYFKDNPRNILLHDIRIEHNGEVAQIDHIIINRLGIEVLESKSFSGELTIKADGSLNVKYGNKIQTFPNPIEQNNRHVKILSEFLKENMELPQNLKLFGIPISSTVLINPKTTLTNDKLPKGFLRADSFITDWKSRVDKMGAITVFKTIGTIISLERAKDIANLLIKHHKAKYFDYEKKYSIKKDIKKKSSIKPMQMYMKESVLENPTIIKNHNTNCLCSKCKSPNLEIRYGKYGYYFKCLFCNGNTAIKLTCSTSNCKPRLKKSKLNFYKICDICGANELFFKNKEREKNTL